MLQRHLPRVMYHQVLLYTKINVVSPSGAQVVQSSVSKAEGAEAGPSRNREREFFVDNLLVRIHCII